MLSHYLQMLDTPIPRNLFLGGTTTNITNFGNIPNITSQITTGAPQADFRCDPASIQRMQDRVRQGSYTMKPTDAELSAYIDTLRQNGLDGSVD